MTNLSRRVVAAGVLLCASASSVFAQTSSSDARTLLGLINAYRKANGASPLALDQRLSRAAQQHVNAMAGANTVSHDISGGFDARMNANGIRGLAAENVAGGHADVSTAFADWQTSSGHNQNMLNPRMRKMGLGRARGSDGRNYWALVLAAN